MRMRGVAGLTIVIGLGLTSACRWEPSPTMVDLRAQQTATTPVSQEYRGEIAAWQQNRAAGLMQEGGWLSLVGLHWLEDGYNSVGSQSSALVELPESAPASVGTIIVSGRRARFDAASEANVTMEGQPVQTVELQSDAAGEPTELRVGSVTFHLIERSGRMGIRVKDSESPARRRFQGLEYYPIDRQYRVEARFVPYDPPKQIPIVNVMGMTEMMVSPGSLQFEIDRRPVSLDPVLETADADRLFVIFGDLTNGAETYGAGRYVYADFPAQGEDTVTLDFNRAYNPPCVFTDYATCPLPPPQNKLQVRIPAGEKKYK